MKRRIFLRRSGIALGGSVFASSVRNFGLVNALAQTGKIETPAPDYKALVCIFMFGGNDCNNMIIPYDGYANYFTRRGVLAIPQANLLQVSPPSQAGVKYGLHPSLSPEVGAPPPPPVTMTGLLPLWTSNKLAVLCNVGTLVQPLTRAQYQGGSPRPDNLFSHEDQADQHQSSIAINTLLSPLSGWGGRLSDKTTMLNGSATFPMIVSLSGSPLFATSDLTRPLVPSSGLTGFTAPVSTDPRYTTMQALMTIDRQNGLVNANSDTMQRAVANTDLLNQALNDSSSVMTVFPSGGLGGQLRQVARVIAKRSTLFGMQRQIFFCSIGGFDTHENQLSPQASLFAQLSQGMKAFYEATVELGVSSSVTTFTLSDFGRTLLPTGSGSDHAWGGHQLIMGGAVLGGDFYGTYPTLTPGGPDDTGSQGRWIPKTSLDQYGWSLARWFGLAPADMGTVFPNIANFSPPDLGFLP